MNINVKVSDIRSNKARDFVNNISKKYAQAISKSIAETSVYDGKTGRHCQCIRPIEETKVSLVQTTTDGALYDLDRNGKTAVLNFASYKHPGGGFLSGAMAQEEALCHTSTLYPVLSAFDDSYYAENRKDTNRGLYRDRALYSKDILFIKDFKEKAYKADVITCASPNNSFSVDTPLLDTPSVKENEIAVRNRIGFVRDICLNEKVDNVILGAWGCGVFAQDPVYVATEFRKAFEGTGINCVYAIPDDKNFTAFKTAFEDYDKTIENEYDIERE